MSISRRHFMLGTAGAGAGLILPSYYQRALEFIDRTGRPLLEAVERPIIEITAYKNMDWLELDYGLAVGDLYAGPPPMTLAEFAKRYDLDLSDWLGLDEGEEPDWDASVDWSDESCFDTWMYNELPEKLAYEALKDIDLGADFCGENSVGQLRLEHGHTMVSSYWNVEAEGEISISLLQKRLNDLGTGIVITLG